MTRINLVPVEELMDQHLLAEYRELPRIATMLRKAPFKSYAILPSIFSLGRGHVRFFYNKGAFLLIRYCALCQECMKRGFKIEPVPFIHFDIFRALGYFNDWAPSKEDIVLSRKRIAEKIAMKPKWYRKTKYDKK